MGEILTSEETTKHKNDVINQRRYWYFFLPLTLFLALMVKFPLRFILQESLFDILFYGVIALDCIITIVRIYRRFGKCVWHLMAVVFLCCVLSGWQVFDLAVLRYNGSQASGFGDDREGFQYYKFRFPNKDILCHTLYERYWGNKYIMITVEINREATWFACGG